MMRSIGLAGGITILYSLAWIAIVAVPAEGRAEDVPTARLSVASREGRTAFVRAEYGPDSPPGLTIKRWSLDECVEAVAPLFKIPDPDRNLSQTRSTTDALGYKHTTYEQVFGGVSVFSGVLKIHQDAAGRFASANGDIHEIPASLSTVPLISPDAAEQTALQVAGLEQASTVVSRLVVVDPGWYGDAAIGPHLAYHVIVASSVSGIEEAFFVDARNGGILDRWSILCTMLTRSIHLHNNLPGEALPGTLARFEGSLPIGNADVDAVYDYTGDVYDYYFNAFGRDGYDDMGSAMVSTVNSAVFACPNAAWTFVNLQATFCPDTVSDDVVAHELTHGVTQFTANLIFQNQPGQLNESFSDVFGERTDLFNSDSAFVGSTGTTPWTAHPTGPGTDLPNNLRGAGCSVPEAGYPDGVRWVLGEDAFGFTSGVGVLRDMWNPPCGQLASPDKASSALQTCSLADNGGVHSGSGIPNHAFAMLCDGATFNGQAISGIGPIKAGAVWYRALTIYLTVASDFTDAYDALNQSAADLVGTFPNDPRTGLPSGSMFSAADAGEVDKALLAVELNLPDVCGETVPVFDSTPPAQCGAKTAVFVDDFESGPGTWLVYNTGPPAPYDWIQTSGLPFGRGGTAWYCEDRLAGDCLGFGESAVHYLESPEILLPGAFTTLTMAFDQYVETEPRYDGGNVEISVNFGPFQMLPTAAYRYNRYNTSLFYATDSSNPLAGQVAFTGVGGDWGRTLVDLSTFVQPGDSLRVRFSFGKDQCFGFDGWYVDDFEIYDCASSDDCNGNGIPDEVDIATGPADVSYISQQPNHSSGNLSDADPHPSLGVNKLADDFLLLRDGTVHKINIWGGYTGNTPVATDAFTVIFHENAGGLPGTVIATDATVASSRALTGETFLGVDEYAFNLTLTAPVSLTAGTYFVEIFNDTTGDATTFIWERGWFGWIPGAAFSGQGCLPWCSDVLNLSLELLGSTFGRAKGDANADGAVDGLDIQEFVSVLLNGTTDADLLCAVDIDESGIADTGDIPPFVTCLLNAGCP